MRRFFVFFVLLLAACGSSQPSTSSQPTTQPTSPPPTTAATNDPCATRALDTYRTHYNDIVSRWGSVIVTAGNTPPTSLGPQIDQMLRIAGELASLRPPICAQQAHLETAEAMKLSIEGYQKLMANQEVGDTLQNSIDLLDLARARVGALPNTLPPTATPEPTNTPLPTPEPTATPMPTATPEPRAGVIISKVAQVFETSESTNPFKSLPRDTKVLVFELVKGRLHIRAGDIEGWVSQSAVQIN